MKFSEIPHRVHFVGIGGIGTSALAQHLHVLGRVVTGSDCTPNDRTHALAQMGVKITIGHNATNAKGAQLVVHTSAVKQDNPELRFAAQHKIPTVLREQLLGAIFNSFPTRIAICGTHGKTTVTAMIHHVLQQMNVAHTAFIGGVYHGNNYFGGGNVVVAEACEYNRSFLQLSPTLSLCLNVEMDHPDCYANAQEVHAAFSQFFCQTQGTVLLPKGLKELVKGQKTTFFDDNTCQNLHFAQGKPIFDYFVDGVKVGSVQLGVVGKHNVTNALATLAVVRSLGLPLLPALASLSSFDGVERRWNVFVASNGALAVCDYAHHPTEIACAIWAAKSICKGQVTCIFQPHTYTRTRAFWQQFATCFQGVRVAYLPVYSARETPLQGTNSSALASYAQSIGVDATFCSTFQRAAQFALQNTAKNDVVLVLGAGDVVQLLPLLKS